MANESTETRPPNGGRPGGRSSRPRRRYADAPLVTGVGRGHGGPGRARRWLSRWWHAEAGGRCGARGDGVLSVALAPAEGLYRIGVGARNRAFNGRLLSVARLPVPVVSVGNLSVGGAGKTPIAAWLAVQLKRRGFAPAVLHGGYAPDEPMLHRHWNPDVPVLAGRDRVIGGRRVIANGATAIVLDDGFQHRRLARDIDLVLVAAETWPRRLRLLPRGPWREAPDSLARATLIAVTRRTASPADAGEVAGIVGSYAPKLPAPIVAVLRPAGWVRADGGAAGSPPTEALAVAGIALPELFAANVQQTGVVVDELMAYPDHYRYGPRDAERIERAAGGRPIVMTEKDWVKLAALLDASRVWLLRQRVEVEEGAATLAAALDGLGGRDVERLDGGRGRGHGGSESGGGDPAIRL